MHIGISSFVITCLFACSIGTGPKTKDQLALEEKKRDITADTSGNLNVGTYDEGDSKTRIKILSYNVLKYGDECQAPNSELHKELATIIKYTAPDIIGLVKVGAFKLSSSDDAKGPAAYQDSINSQALNTAFPGRFAVCPTTNIAQGNNVNLLFYNKEKFGYSSMKNLCSSETDFDIYKLYDKQLTSKNDTAYLYFILNHTKSGDKSEKRDEQAACIKQALKKEFKRLPDLIDMGDFNLRNTEEPGYHSLVAESDENQKFFDPPFALDHKVSYPADWDNEPEKYAPFLTTSTRKKDDEPNTCGTGGGAKAWFDHILLSKSLTLPNNKMHYVPNSYHTVGNDGHRVGISVNQKKEPNSSVPKEVADALFNFSNKYPVILELEINQKH